MEKMRFEDFAKAVVATIREYLPETFKNAVVELSTVVKNNDMKLTGLTIRSGGESDACPLIYLEQFFEQYKAGEEMKKILQEIAAIRLSTELPDAFDIEQVTRFESAKERIVPRVIGREWNKILLQDRPYTAMEDLAITYHILMGTGKNDLSSIPITNGLMEKWEVGVEELHDAAIGNMKDLLPATFKGMSSVMSAMISGEDPDQEWFAPEDEAMFILSNREGVFGATSILNENLMDRVVSVIGKDFFILPSSVHEMLLVPQMPDMEVSDLAAMVREANASIVEPCDRLSNHVYTYSKAGGLKIAG